MMGRQAPIFSPKALAGSGLIGAAFTEWVQHYNHCVDCQRDDWYTPHANEELFCPDGRRLFRTWSKLNSGLLK